MAVKAMAASEQTREIDPDQLVAFVRAFGSNVFEVYSWPESRIVDVAVALRRSGISSSPVAIDADGIPKALLLFSETDYTVSDMVRVAATLQATGIRTYAYELVHEHDIIDIDLFRRVHPVTAVTDENGAAQGAEDPLFMRVQHLDEINERGDVIAFGSAERLEQFAALAEGLVDSIDPVQGQHGIESVTVQFGYDVLERARALFETLNEHGIDLHIRAFKA